MTASEVPSAVRKDQAMHQGREKLMGTLLFLTGALLLGGCHPRSSTGLPVVELRVGGASVKAEVAATELDRSTGLMFRTHMGEDEGMLFVFDRASRQAFWMRNTYLPLSIAFLDPQGVILNLEEMQPQTESPHWSAGPALYALEMNQGWFAKHRVVPGMRVEGLDALPRPSSVPSE